MFKNTKNQESGISMLEIIGVMTVMIMIVVGGFILIRNAMAAQRRNTVMDEVSKIVTGMRTLYADYDAFPKQIDSDGVMAAMAVDTNSAIEGATYTVTAQNGKRLFSIHLSVLDGKDYTVLSSRTWPGATNVGGSCKNGKDECELVLTYDK
ncbi:MAG: hypothetical protein J6S57_03390 [Alphaproteobacteria bacterium]|nr:hypothetical protein [Alphaproteobacteria bacterium]